MLTIYKASAGSGKTFNLALEYIKALLGKKNPDGTYTLADLRKERRRHRHILAITFTNKATEEMKTRIIKELASLGNASSSDNPSEYAKILTQHFHCDLEALAKNASIALQQLLFDFNFFSVSTIDSFFQLVLRTFAREIDKPGNFEIELNNHLAMAMAASMMLRELETSEHPQSTPVGSWIKQLMEDKLEVGEKFNIFNSDEGESGVYGTMISFLSRMNDETFKENAADVLEYLSDPTRIDSFRRQLFASIRNFTIEVSAKAKAITEFFEKNGVDLVGSKMLNSTLTSRIRTWQTGKFSWEEKSAAIPAIASGEKTPLTSDYAKGKKPVLAGIEHMATDIATCFMRNSILSRIYTKVLDGIYYLGLMGHAARYIDRFRRENNLILLSDTNDLLGTIISDSDTPFIYERLGVQLQHYLIDEFQDTSRMQWHNLRPLIANSESTDNDNLIIGDEKQSIYRFRNADASLLHKKVAEDFPGSHRTRGNAEGENTNFRSYENIVKFNNEFFTTLADTLGADTYGNVVQNIAEKNIGKGGHVKLISYPASNEEGFAKFSLDYTAKEIRRLTEAGYRYSDITILVIRRKEGIKVVNYLVSEHPDIRISSDEALLINSNPTVRLILSVLQLVQASRQNNSISNEKEYATPHEISLIIRRLQYLLSRGHDLDSAISLVRSTENDTAADTISMINERHSSTLMSMVEYIESAFIDPETRERDKAFITAFNDHLADYCSTHNSDLHSFLQWWKLASDKFSVPSAEDVDAVRVMTVHKSKGLQSKCVIIPYFKASIVSQKQSDWYDSVPLPGISQDVIPPIMSLPVFKQLTDSCSPFRQQALEFRRENTLDALNLTYVAFTRAIAELTIIAGKEDSSTVAPWLTAGTASGKFGSARWQPLEIYPTPTDGTEEESTPTTKQKKPVQPFIFEFGESTLNSISDKDRRADEERKRSTLKAPEFKSTFRTDTDRYTCIEDPSQPEYLDSPDAASAPSDKLTATEEQIRGDLLHRVLSLIHRADDLDHAFDRVAQSRRIDRTRRTEYLDILKKAFADNPEHVRRWFIDFDHTLNERPIYLPERQATYRPDRVVWTNDDTVEIVDYKFTAAASDEHITQVRGYMYLLRAMGFGNVRAYLWYLLTGEIKEVRL